jgi:hypothetical protein
MNSIHSILSHTAASTIRSYGRLPSAVEDYLLMPLLSEAASVISLKRFLAHFVAKGIEVARHYSERKLIGVGQL